ncbi:MAG: FAD/NAD(P)-binding protein [Saprospiraceae bacterium]|nr:FAD/NAD(P)-binding protein [Pyrinomonadaceae bacterium]
MKKITIIGGGASGTLLAVNLLKNAGDAPLAINLVEKRSAVGRGVAYSTTAGVHLLNVPAAKMGAFSNDIGNFYQWLTEKDLPYDDHAFVPRKIYGNYLRETLEQAIANKPKNIQFNIIDDEAVDMSVDDSQSQVILKSGEILVSDKVVLAFGNSLPPHPNVENMDFTLAPKYFRDQWSPEVYTKIEKSDSVLIIGTGLSMVDLTMHYHAVGHGGKIKALSTRGLLPAVHSLGHTYPSFYDELKPMTRITDLLKAVRRHIKKAESEGSNWRGVIDSLRPHTPQIWLDLPIAEKRYFMQHLSRYWNVARHRVPMEAAVILDEMQADGRLEVLKGRLQKIEVNPSGKFETVFKTDGTENSMETDAIINCIGSQSNFEKLESPLVKSMVARGHIRNDELNLGIAALPNGRIIGKTGAPSNVLLTLGTALKGTLWETTAIPEIRTQAQALALQLLDKES